MATSDLDPAQTSGFYLLPREILRQVISEIYVPRGGEVRAWSIPGRTARHAWLATSVLISQHWASQVYPVLYHKIYIRQYSQAVSLLRSLTRRPVLVGLVRHITVSPSIGEPAEPTSPRAWWQADVLQARALAKARQKYWRTYQELFRLFYPPTIHSFQRFAPPAIESCSTTPVDYGFLACYFRPAALTLAFPIGDSVVLDLLGFAQVRDLRLVGNGSPQPVRFSNWSGFQCHFRSLYLQELNVSDHDMALLLSNLYPDLEILQCYGLHVFHAVSGEILPLHHWISPVRDTLREFTFDDNYFDPDPMDFRVLRKVTLITADIAVIPVGLRPEDFLPRSIQRVELVTAWRAMTDRYVFISAGAAWQIIQADRAALPDLRKVTISLAVYNKADLVTWQLLSFLLKELAERRGLEFTFSANVVYWHNGDSFEWRNPGAPARGRISRILDRPLALARRLRGRESRTPTSFFP